MVHQYGDRLRILPSEGLDLQEAMDRRRLPGICSRRGCPNCYSPRPGRKSQKMEEKTVMTMVRLVRSERRFLAQSHRRPQQDAAALWGPHRRWRCPQRQTAPLTREACLHCCLLDRDREALPQLESPWEVAQTVRATAQYRLSYIKETGRRDNQPKSLAVR